MSKIGEFCIMMISLLCEGLVYVNHGANFETVLFGVGCIFASVTMIGLFVTLVVYAVRFVIWVIKEVIRYKTTDWSELALQEFRKYDIVCAESVKTETNEKEGA